MLTEVTEDAEAEGHARRVILDLYELTIDQPARWVLVDVLKRRLGPLSAEGVDVGIAHAEGRRWVESDGPARMRRVRLANLGRATLWLRIAKRPRPPEHQIKPVVVTPSAMVRH